MRIKGCTVPCSLDLRQNRRILRTLLYVHSRSVTLVAKRTIFTEQQFTHHLLYSIRPALYILCTVHKLAQFLKPKLKLSKLRSYTYFYKEKEGPT